MVKFIEKLRETFMPNTELMNNKINEVITRVNEISKEVESFKHPKKLKIKEKKK